MKLHWYWQKLENKFNFLLQVLHKFVFKLFCLYSQTCLKGYLYIKITIYKGQFHFLHLINSAYNLICL
jgi:hypothetical protein